MHVDATLIVQVLHEPPRQCGQTYADWHAHLHFHAAADGRVSFERPSVDDQGLGLPPISIRRGSSTSFSVAIRRETRIVGVGLGLTICRDDP